MSTDDYKRGLERAAEIARTAKAEWEENARTLPNLPTCERDALKLQSQANAARVVADAIEREASAPPAAVQPGDEALVREMARVFEGVLADEDGSVDDGARAALAVVRRADAGRGGEVRRCEVEHAGHGRCAEAGLKSRCPGCKPAAPPVDPKVCGRPYGYEGETEHVPAMACQLPPNHEPEPCGPRRTT